MKTHRQKFSSHIQATSTFATFLRHAAKAEFYFPQNTTYFLILSFCSIFHMHFLSQELSGVTSRAVTCIRGAKFTAVTCISGAKFTAVTCIKY
jgi:hypothetical protein